MLQLVYSATIHALTLFIHCSNDAFDADMNTDGNKPESVVNLTGNRNGVLAAAFACFAVGVTWLWSLVTGTVRIVWNNL